MADAFAIDVTDLRKTYEEVEALRGLTLRVAPGSIFGFLGRNGAGKTTTIKILLGMARPTAGAVRVFGLPADDRQASVAIRRRVGFVSDDKDLPAGMTVGEAVRFTASFFPRWRSDLSDRYARMFELAPDRRLKTLSRGTRTKVALLLALCRGADLLVLDEPTTGLDPAATEEVLKLLVAHAAREGTTIFFSSHQIAEVEQIADTIGIVDRGRTVVSGGVDDLREKFRRIELVFDGAPPQAVFRSAGVRRVTRSGRVMTVLSSSGAESVVDEARSLGATSVDVMPVTLKDIFLEAVAVED